MAFTSGSQTLKGGVILERCPSIKPTPFGLLVCKGNPPYPPLTGGQEKAKPLSPAGTHRLFIPPCQGGVGGVAFQAEGGRVKHDSLQTSHPSLPGTPDPLIRGGKGGAPARRLFPRLRLRQSDRDFLYFRAFAFMAGEETRWPGKNRSGRDSRFWRGASRSCGFCRFRFSSMPCSKRSPRPTGMWRFVLIAVYAYAVLSDLVDGPLARRANAKSYFWGQVDAFTDVAFNAAALTAAFLTGVIGRWAAVGVLMLGAQFIWRCWIEAGSAGRGLARRCGGQVGGGLFLRPGGRGRPGSRSMLALAQTRTALAQHPGFFLRTIFVHPKRARVL